ncbi:3-hydroxyisobutyrate dehydrogenase [bacterium HR39]|nr:3-hydroxyisobutyrate dehydrogenase [bacterium HR39]
MKVAFFGLGNMGLPMARNLAKAGHEVVGYDVVEAARERACAANLAVAHSPAAALGGAEAVITMLPAGPHVREAYLGGDGILAHAPAGALLVDSSTIDVETARLVHREA